MTELDGPYRGSNFGAGYFNVANDRKGFQITESTNSQYSHVHIVTLMASDTVGVVSVLLKDLT